MYWQEGCKFPTKLLCHQTANFDIFTLNKIYLDFNNVKVSNKAIRPLRRNYSYQNEYITLLNLIYDVYRSENVKIFSYLASHANSIFA